MYSLHLCKKNSEKNYFVFFFFFFFFWKRIPLISWMTLVLFFCFLSFKWQKILFLICHQNFPHSSLNNYRVVFFNKWCGFIYVHYHCKLYYIQSTFSILYGEYFEVISLLLLLILFHNVLTACMLAFLSSCVFSLDTWRRQA